MFIITCTVHEIENNYYHTIIIRHNDCFYFPAPGSCSSDLQFSIPDTKPDRVLALASIFKVTRSAELEEEAW